MTRFNDIKKRIDIKTQPEIMEIKTPVKCCCSNCNLNAKYNLLFLMDYYPLCKRHLANLRDKLTGKRRDKIKTEQTKLK